MGQAFGILVVAGSGKRDGRGESSGGTENDAPRTRSDWSTEDTRHPFHVKISPTLIMVCLSQRREKNTTCVYFVYSRVCSPPWPYKHSSSWYLGRERLQIVPSALIVTMGSESFFFT
ncbi:unnamed protein product [Ectocarpus sp. 8 AP-2014]